MDFYEQIKRGIKLFSFTYIDWLTKFELFSTSSFFFFITFFLRLHPLFVYMSISYVVPIQHKSLFFLLKFTIFYFFLVLYCILFSNTHIDNSVSNKYNSIVDKWIYFSPCHRFDWFHSRNGFIGFSVIQEVFFLYDTICFAISNSMLWLRRAIQPLYLFYWDSDCIYTF